jgi:two-component system, LytTR family, response regulator
VSKSFIVNINAIDRIVPWFNSTLLLKVRSNQPDITVTRNYLNNFKDYLNM